LLSKLLTPSYLTPASSSEILLPGIKETAAIKHHGHPGLFNPRKPPPSKFKRYPCTPAICPTGMSSIGDLIPLTQFQSAYMLQILDTKSWLRDIHLFIHRVHGAAALRSSQYACAGYNMDGLISRMHPTFVLSRCNSHRHVSALYRRES
jgi:hypothetical protein